MEAGSSGGFDAGNRHAALENEKSSASKGSTRRQGKDPANAKANPDPSGTRFQCPRCPKNFSRIENLTRHQANHDDVGKFACAVCRKRFTRSDLLNRHRRIHGNQPESSTSHVTPQDYSSVSPPQADPQGAASIVSREDRSSTSSQEGSSSLSSYGIHGSYQNQPQQPSLYVGHSQDAYQTVSHNSSLSGPDSTILQNHPVQNQGLTSLMEAALAPQDAFAFTPVENINPSLWNGFMLFGDNANSYMGSYDADISWTFNSFPSGSSPNNFVLDHDMMDPMDDFGLNPYQYNQDQAQVLQYDQQNSSQIDEADSEDEDTNDWPDKVSKPATPHHRAPRIVPLQLLPISWQPVLDEARSSGLSALTIRPFHIISDQIRAAILSALNGAEFRNEISRPEISDAIFPPSEILEFFLRLYVRYIQPRFPVLHLPTFNIYDSSPLLLVAMMFLGSSHSNTDRGRFSRLFHEHLRIACIRMQEIDLKYLRSVENILTYFLLCLAGTWSGSKQSYEFAEGGRGILVTACRRCRLLDCRPSARVEIEQFQYPGRPHLEAAWLAWAETEKRKRLGLSIYIFDCQYPALFNNQPYVSKAETTNCIFPCPEDYWEAPSAESWKMLVGPADMPPSTYYLHALNCCLLRKWVKPPPPIARTGEFGKLLLVYAIHTHVFEWRQSCSMLNPTGLIGTFGNSAIPIGEGLKERRRWLVDGLDSWGECYQKPGTTAAASLLHRLAYISLDVSLSDMHLVAGRSAHKHDGNFAEENLKHWANSEIADSTMTHVYTMLEICHREIAKGTVADSSYEVAVCLFTGGIVCWAYAKLRVNAARQQYIEQVRKASTALRQMGCWRLCNMFGRILSGFEVPKVG